MGVEKIAYQAIVEGNGNFLIKLEYEPSSLEGHLVKRVKPLFVKEHRDSVLPSPSATFSTIIKTPLLGRDGVLTIERDIILARSGDAVQFRYKRDNVLYGAKGSNGKLIVDLKDIKRTTKDSKGDEELSVLVNAGYSGDLEFVLKNDGEIEIPLPPYRVEEQIKKINPEYRGMLLDHLKAIGVVKSSVKGVSEKQIIDELIDNILQLNGG